MKKIALSILLIVSLCFTIFALTGCGNSNNSKEEITLVGNWKTNFAGYDYTYTFNDNGTGKYDAAGTVMEFTYTTEGNTISILYTGNTAPFKTEYSIDGETLNVKDSFGNDTLYKRVK